VCQRASQKYQEFFNMTLLQEIMVEYLAFADALWEPIREPMSVWWSATWVLRWEYGEKGLPWRAGGSKDLERGLSLCVKAGWLMRRRANRKTTAVVLTLAGMQEAWRLMGISPGHARLVLEEVARKSGPERRWVPEIEFNEGRGWGDGRHQELKLITAFHAPALTAQWIESQCDHYGRVGYRPTERGIGYLAELQAHVSGNGKVHTPDPDPPEPDPEIVDLYGRTYRQSIMWLNAQDAVSVGRRGEIGNIPLPVSAWLETGGYCGP
jgi:hypothetical protein